MDRPGYLGAIQTFRAAGARLVGWDLRAADLDELEDLILRYRPKLLYTNPTFQNPTGFTLPLRARRELLRLAGRYRLPIIEDDTYRELHIDAAPPPSLHALDDRHIVIHLNSFSKMLAPGLRLGWLSAAESIVEQLALVKQRVDPHTQNLVQLAVAELVEDGAFDAHVAALRAEHASRRDLFARALARHLPDGALRLTRPQGGLYFWAQLADGVRAADLLQRATASGLVFVTGESFYPDQGGAHELRLCFTSVPPASVEDGAARLGQSLRAAVAAGAAAPLMPIV
jgi:DNA-binding transcriptional MocR family regulator